MFGADIVKLQQYDTCVCNVVLTIANAEDMKK